MELKLRLARTRDDGFLPNGNREDHILSIFCTVPPFIAVLRRSSNRWRPLWPGGRRRLSFQEMRRN